MDKEWRKTIRYQKARLTERSWHKFVIWHLSDETILEHLEKLNGPVMFRNGGEWKIVMISDEIDRVHFKLLADLKLDDDRGYGQWGKFRYCSRESNRIPGT